MLTHWKKSYDQPRQHIKKQRYYLANKGLSSQSYGFSSNHVWMWELDYKESWVPKNWCFWTVVLEKTLESPLDSKEIQPIHPKGDQSWVSLEGLMLKLKLQYFCHLMWRADSFEKTPMLGKTEGRRRRGQQRDGNRDGITDSMDMSLSKLGVGNGQGGLACCCPWGLRVRHNWVIELKSLKKQKRRRKCSIVNILILCKANYSRFLNKNRDSDPDPCTVNTFTYNLTALCILCSTSQIQPILDPIVLFIEKKSASKWTCAVQTCVAEQSTASPIKSLHFHLGEWRNLKGCF